MKQILYLLILCALVSTTASAQHIMVVEQNDNTTTEFNVDDIKRVYFKNNDTPTPSNSVLSSRLKDKDGNPVLLEGIKRKFSSDVIDWYMKFEYDENGGLTSLYCDGVTYYVNGLSITIPGVEGVMDFSLNENGLISEFVYKYEYKVNGILREKVDFKFLFYYDSENHLIKREAYGFSETYNEDGTLKQLDSSDTTNIVHYITWSNGNIIDSTGFFTHNYSYSDNINITKQKVCRYLFSELDPLECFSMIGLFGVWSQNFPLNGTYTVNPNGTVATEGDQTYYYK